MPTVTIEYPDNLPDQLGESREQFEAEARMALAVKLFEQKRIPSGVAASLAKVDRKAFLLGLHRFGVPMIDIDRDELLSDMRNA